MHSGKEFVMKRLFISLIALILLALACNLEQAATPTSADDPGGRGSEIGSADRPLCQRDLESAVTAQ